MGLGYGSARSYPGLQLNKNATARVIFLKKEGRNRGGTPGETVGQGRFYKLTNVSRPESRNIRKASEIAGKEKGRRGGESAKKLTRRKKRSSQTVQGRKGEVMTLKNERARDNSLCAGGDLSKNAKQRFNC